MSGLALALGMRRGKKGQSRLHFYPPQKKNPRICNCIKFFLMGGIGICLWAPQKSFGSYWFWREEKFVLLCLHLCFEKTNHSIKAQKNFLAEFISFCHQIIGRVLVNFSNSIQLALLSRHATAQRNMSRLLASVCENSKNSFLVMLFWIIKFSRIFWIPSHIFQSTSQLHNYSQLNKSS